MSSADRSAPPSRAAGRLALSALARPPQSGAGWLGRVTLLALLYGVTGWAGLQLAQSAGYATPVWPPSGIMLALLLLWGYGVWPGVWLGAFAVNVWVGAAQVATLPDALGVAAAIASGSTAEGLLGAWLVRRLVRVPLRLDNGADVTRFFVLGGVVAGALAATVGTLTLQLAGRLEPGQIGFNWLTWWIGDCMGVFLVAPALLLAATEPGGLRSPRLGVVLATVTVSLAVGALVVHEAGRSERQRIAAHFEREAASVDRRLTEALAGAVNAVATLADYYNASEWVDAEEFERFAAGQRARAPGLAVLAWAPRVPAAARPQAEIYELQDQRRVPAAARAEYFPVRQVSPRAGNEDVPGFDLNSEPARAQTLADARASGQLRISPPVELISGRGRGVVAVAPVASARGEGVVLGVIVFERLMARLLPPGAAALLGVSLAEVGAAPVTAGRIGAPATDAELVWTQAHRLGGREWRVQVHAGDAYLNAQRTLQIWLTQIGVLLFSALLGGFLLVLTGRSQRVERLVRERTAELQEKNRTLRREVAERERSEARQKLSAEVFDHIGEGIMITDADNRIISVNRAFSVITGYNEAEVIGSTPHLLSSGRHDTAFYADLWQRLKQVGAWRGEIWDRRKTGEVIPLWLDLSLLRDAAGRVSHHVAVLTDISERKAAEERMLFLAQIDTLTELPNRCLLVDRLQQTLESARRNREHFAVLFIDIDRFKNINDSLGHGVGDALLRETADRLRASVRASDTVARHGGDEFVIVMPAITDAEQVAHVAGKILDAVAQPCHIEQHALTATASVGIALYPADAADGEGLMKNADAAMYVAKSSGRNAFRFFTRDMNVRVQEFLQVETDLRRALAANELRVHYQPQFDVFSGEVVGMEALVRWEHPVRGLLWPSEFIHIAEESGLIEAIGDWVLREACRHNRAWQDQGLRRVPVAVNLSANELHRRSTVARIDQALRASGLDAQWLELEITESALMRDVEHVGQMLHELRAMGVLIALDDFGTGYSSLAHLRRFPLSVLKVDRSFVSDLPTDSNDAAICRAVIALGRTLGLRVVAEGVDNVAQLAFLRNNRCDAVQGALFSWAVAPERMAEFLQPSYVCLGAFGEASLL